MELVNQVYETQILPLLSPLISKVSGSQAYAVARRNKMLSIGAAVALTVVYMAYSTVTRPPKHLRHIPSANNIKLLKAYLSGWPINDIATKITIPAALQSDRNIYVRYDINGWMVRIQDPVAAKKFLLKTDLFPKYSLQETRDGTINGEFFGKPNLVTVSGDQWKSHRKIANPAFHRSMPVELFGTLTHKLFKLMDNLGETVDYLDLMTRFTLDAIGLAGFGFDFHAIEDRHSPWVEKYDRINAAMWSPLFLFLPVLEQKFLWAFPERQRRHKDLQDFLSMLDGVIAHKRKVLKEQQQDVDQTAENEKDLLTLMIESENKGEGALSDEELKANLCIFFLAGHDTTANSLSCAVYYLAANPDIQQKAREEALSVLGDGPDDIHPTVEQSKNLPYINCIIRETLRMNPPAASLLPRTTTQDTDLNGVLIPKGTLIGIDVHELHHNPRVWKDPEVFNPDRFLEGGEADELTGKGMTWLPFSNGSRQCIGMNFSLAEQRVLLPLLLRKYEWSLPEDSIHKKGLVTTGMGIICPKNLQIVFKKRH